MECDCPCCVIVTIANRPRTGDWISVQGAIFTFRRDMIRPFARHRYGYSIRPGWRKSTTARRLADCVNASDDFSARRLGTTVSIKHCGGHPIGVEP